MALEPNPSLYPPSGFFHREPDGTRFRGTSWNEVIDKVRQYREQRGKPAGDVRSEIFATVCRASPQYCRDPENPRPPSQPRPARTPDAPRAPAYVPPAGRGNIAAQITNWLHRLTGLKRKQQLEFVPRPEARRRAGICASCPKMQVISSNCGGCMSVQKTVKALLLAGHAEIEKSLASCSVLGEDCGVSCHIIQPSSGNGALPANCWRKNQ